MAVGTPVVATPQGALVEFVLSGQNGLMLTLSTDEIGEWRHIGRADKATPAYGAMFREETERLAQELITAVAPYCDNAKSLRGLRANARSTAETMFDGLKTSAYLDDLYERCVTQ